MYEAMGIAGAHGKTNPCNGWRKFSQLAIYATIGFGAFTSIMIAMGIGIVSNIKQGHFRTCTIR